MVYPILPVTEMSGLTGPNAAAVMRDELDRLHEHARRPQHGQTRPLYGSSISTRVLTIQRV